MNCLISNRLALSAIFLGAAFSAVAEDLDAALAAQKEKAKRRVYSETARIEDRNLLVPTLPTDEEKALDRELEQLENRLNNQVVQPQGMMMYRRPAVVPVRQENWLTPAMLDPENSKDLSSEKNASGWVDLEVERQKELRLQKKMLAEEEALVNKMLREESRQMVSPETSRLKQYETTLWNTISPGAVPQRTLINPLESLRPKDPAAPSGTASLFSPAVRSSSGVIQPSGSPSTRTTDWQPKFGEPKAPSGFTSTFDVTQPTPLTPLKRIRQSSPIHKKDPFAEDFMPGNKAGIWDN